ncbi:HEPN domain-containing protein [Candidatus Micrarchaeota archaeon]|nr:HEPN domain-containing protein [Candidatus Micrarchaeota archaeon]
MDIASLVSKNYLTRIPPALDLADKEWAESELDLEEASKEIRNKGYKWAIIKSYYSMFHSAKAILFLMGLKEKSHYAVSEVLNCLSTDGKLESRYVNDFKAGVSAREGADYHYSHEEKTAKDLFDIATEFVERMRSLAKKL